MLRGDREVQISEILSMSDGDKYNEKIKAEEGDRVF